MGHAQMGVAIICPESNLIAAWENAPDSLLISHLVAVLASCKLVGTPLAATAATKSLSFKLFFVFESNMSP